MRTENDRKEHEDTRERRQDGESIIEDTHMEERRVANR